MTSIFNKSQYSRTTISTYDLLASYFVDVYYNHLYAEAIKMMNDSSNPISSITEGYRHCVLAFITAIDNTTSYYKAKHYSNMLKEINEYFTKWTSFSTLSLSECINRIVKEFVPSDYFTSLNKDQKRNLLRRVLVNSIREFSKLVVQEYITNIIDNHNDKDNIVILKERLIELFILEREAIFTRFIDNSNQTVDKGVAYKLRDELKNVVTAYKELSEKYKLQHELQNTLEQKNKQLTTQLEEKTLALNTQISNNKKLIHKLKASIMEINKLKEMNSDDTLKNNYVNLETTHNNLLKEVDSLHEKLAEYESMLEEKNKQINNLYAEITEMEEHTTQNVNVVDDVASDVVGESSNVVEVDESSNVVEVEEENEVSSESNNVVEVEEKNEVSSESNNMVDDVASDVAGEPSNVVEVDESSNDVDKKVQKKRRTRPKRTKDLTDYADLQESAKRAASIDFFY